MLRKMLPLLVAAGLLLAACQPAAAPAAKKTPSGPPMEGCQVVDLLPEPDPALLALLPAVSADDHALGNKQALVTFIEYSDFQ